MGTPTGFICIMETWFGLLPPAYFDTKAQFVLSDALSSCQFVLPAPRFFPSQLENTAVTKEVFQEL